ncbi:MAG: LPS assembly protein LptD [Pseudomonadota bacterium]
MPGIVAINAAHLTICSAIRASLLLLVISATAQADDAPDVCYSPDGPPIAVVDSAPPLAAEQINLEAGRGEISLTGDAVLENGVSASNGSFRVEANQGTYQRNKGVLSLLDDVLYQGGGATISGGAAVFDYLYGQVEFTDAEFKLGNGASRGAASLLRINRTGNIRLEESRYTSCPEGRDDWMISAKKIRLDTDNGVGEANGLTLRFKGVPILYSPYLSFPISAKRKTGFLIPEISRSRRNGFTLGAPWYWNIAPAFDATITPRYLSSRGAQIDTTFRYLTPVSRGDIRVAYLPDDDILGIDRTLFEWQNTSNFAGRWQAFADVTDVSDTAYLEDLGGSLNSASATHLDRSVGLRYRGPYTQAEARLTHYQTIDALISADNEPYRLLPQIRANTLYDKLPGGVSLQLETELTAFDRDVGITGQRYHVAPSIGLDIERNGFYFRPKLQWLYTHYKLDQDTTTGDTSLTRSMPTAEFMTGLTLERDVDGGRYRQTLEPHLYFVHVPFRDQTDIPVFDTIVPIASIEQLYRSNRFIGLDRIGDTDQATFGITTRLISNEDGKSILTATLGQSRYLSEQAVSLPGVVDSVGNSSDYIAELRLNVWGNWNLDLSQQWNSERSETTKSEIRLQYLPGKDRVVNLGYRFRRDAIDQGDISFSWPISSRWNAVGRYNYSFREDTSLERFFGLEYESCCWGVKIVSRRFISRRDGTADSAIAIQLELKGLSSVGDSVDSLLENGILGYQTN